MFQCGNRILRIVFVRKGRSQAGIGEAALGIQPDGLLIRENGPVEVTGLIALLGSLELTREVRDSELVQVLNLGGFPTGATAVCN